MLSATIEIHSESIRNFPNHSGICIRIKQFPSNLIRRNFSIPINPQRIQNQSWRIRAIRINPNLQSALNRSIRLKPNISESFGLIRIDQIHSKWPDSIGLFWFDRIHSDWKFGLILINSYLNGFNRIDSDWFWCSSDWFGLKNFFGLDRNETVWFGYKFRNDSENFGLIYPWLVYPNQSEIFRIIPEFVFE